MCNKLRAVRLTPDLLEVHDEWVSAERRYFSEASMADLYPERDDEDATRKELALSE